MAPSPDIPTGCPHGEKSSGACAPTRQRLSGELFLNLPWSSESTALPRCQSDVCSSEDVTELRAVGPNSSVLPQDFRLPSKAELDAWRLKNLQKTRTTCSSPLVKTTHAARRSDELRRILQQLGLERHHLPTLTEQNLVLHDSHELAKKVLPTSPGFSHLAALTTENLRAHTESHKPRHTNSKYDGDQEARLSERARQDSHRKNDSDLCLQPATQPSLVRDILSRVGSKVGPCRRRAIWSGA